MSIVSTLGIIIGLSILAGIIFLIYKTREIKAPEDNKMIFDYFEALRKELRETSTSSRKETFKQ